MKTFNFRKESDYWDMKLANYIHDPPDKALRIPGHEERSRALADALGSLPVPDKNLYGRADRIAAGMDRTLLPGYHRDATKNGAVDFTARPCLTHPIAGEFPLRVKFDNGFAQSDVERSMSEIIRRDLGGEPGKGGLSDQFQGRPTEFSAARFYYFHHVFRMRLANENAGGLGALWYRLPADTRIPDHSIWQHCSLVSALASCFSLSEKAQAALMVFSITPVQDFIARARKLRDFWAGSLILSWLAFEGVRRIVYDLGSDHVLYPSLVGQPLMDEVLVRELRLAWLASDQCDGSSGEVASLPNKFVCLVPAGAGIEAETAGAVRDSIVRAWTEMRDATLRVVEQLTRADEYLETQFSRQFDNYWSFKWSACPLLDETAIDTVKKLLHQSVWSEPIDFLRSSSWAKSRSGSEGGLYGVTHALTQSFLAAGKSRREDQRQPEPGIKCSLHGDFEVLRFKEQEDLNPPASNDPFWSAFKLAWHAKPDFKPSERLSAVGLMKRVAYRVCRSIPAHPLRPFFAKAERFPSTTEMALSDWLEEIRSEAEHLMGTESLSGWESTRKQIAQFVHESEEERGNGEAFDEISVLSREERSRLRELIEKLSEKHPLQEEDKYYAILLMDGDRIGRLVNGETISAQWRTVQHPDLVARLERTDFDPVYHGFWSSRLHNRRLLAPAVHAAISESLADFSLYTVPRIVNKYHGRLIYAGGDDVCAVMPVSTVVDAAREIAAWYREGFVFVPPSGKLDPQALDGEWIPAPGRLAMHLGRGAEISISAGILICHHKKPFSAAMTRAHELLSKNAKREGGRNALAMELNKRSGGPRILVVGWNEFPWSDVLPSNAAESGGGWTLLDYFLQLGDAIGNPSARSLSSSLVYRLEELRPGLEAVIKTSPSDLVPLILKQIERSGTTNVDEKPEALALRVAALIARSPRGKEPAIETESIVMSKFVGTCRIRARRRHGERP